MDELVLNESLMRYFFSYYVSCKDDTIGQVPTNKVIELIKSGNVPDDVLKHVRVF